MENKCPKCPPLNGGTMRPFNRGLEEKCDKCGFKRAKLTDSRR